MCRYDGFLGEYVNKKVEETNKSINAKIVCTKYVPYNELPNYICNLKFMLFLSKGEGLLSTLLEAIACGTIVIATSAGGIPDIVKDRKTGYLIETAEPARVLEKLLTILNEEEKLCISIKLRSF